jgi:heme exporter protein D
MSWLDELARELAHVGIRGGLRRRILAELDDHLRCEAGSEVALGSPAQIAARFADELGTAGARRASGAAFAGLAFAGTLFAVVFLMNNLAGPAPDVFAGAVPGAALLLQTVIVLAPQVAFVAGAMGAWRAFRLRREPVLPAAEVRVLNRRTAVAIVSALAAFLGLGLYAVDYRGELAGWWVTLAVAASVLSMVVLVVASVSLLRTLRLRPAASGAAGDLYADLPLLPRLSPWSLACGVAVLFGVVVTAALAVQGDPFDGLSAGLAEAAAVLIGFAVLAGPLGLRPAHR